uniref:Uncharacterized protein n=1 Tax=Octactis speculum TaxID=3111310 RepID=A0A7S2DIY2_9STRA|mmetsp:Transcript_4980/g.6020  ORF Transcript_4980/g.6020 Transcript_4980/m.6020 type:complete len:111 (+) Transcript_4980:433-765(+)
MDDYVLTQKTRSYPDSRFFCLTWKPGVSPSFDRRGGNLGETSAELKRRGYKGNTGETNAIPTENTTPAHSQFVFKKWSNQSLLMPASGWYIIKKLQVYERQTGKSGGSCI